MGRVRESPQSEWCGSGTCHETEQPRQETYSEQQKHNEPSIGIRSLGLFDTTNPVYDPAEEEFRRRMQNKKKRRGPKL